MKKIIQLVDKTFYPGGATLESGSLGEVNCFVLKQSKDT